MGLLDTIRSAVGSGFAALGDVAEDATWRRVAGIDYDPAIGSVRPRASDAPIKAVFTSYSSREIESGAAQPEDIKALALAANFDAPPQIGDVILRADGTERSVVGVQVDPAAAMYTLQLRRPS